MPDPAADEGQPTELLFGKPLVFVDRKPEIRGDIILTEWFECFGPWAELRKEAKRQP